MSDINVSTLTMPRLVLEHARTSPDAVALRQKTAGGWREISWSTYGARAAACAAGLLALGVERPAHVAVLAGNRAEWVIAQMAAGLIRGVALGCYPTSSPDELRHALGHADVRVLFCEGAAHLARIEAIRRDLPLLEQVILIEPAAGRDDVMTMDALERQGAAALVRSPNLIAESVSGQTLDDVGLIVYTSGSTGAPKAAQLSYRNMRAAAVGFGPSLGYGPDSGLLSYLPLCHIAEQAMSNFAPIYAGSMVSFGGGLPSVLEDLRSVRPTYFSGVPRVWQKLRDEIIARFDAEGRRAELGAALEGGVSTAFKRRSDWSAGDHAAFRSRAAVVGLAKAAVGLQRAAVATSGAARLQADILLFFRALDFPLLELFGQTEACSVMTLQRPDKVVAGTVGEPIHTVELKLAADSEILVRGENVFVGYYKNPPATADTIVDGWLMTGDVGEIEDGQLRIIDRKKDIMITDGGKNIAPAEIEALMRSSPLIQECVLVGEGRKYLTALIQVEPAAFEGLASRYEALATDPGVEARVASEIARLNASLARVAQIKRACILPTPLSHDAGALTPTLKLRRFRVHQSHGALIEGLYRGEAGFVVPTGDRP